MKSCPFRVALMTACLAAGSGALAGPLAAAPGEARAIGVVLKSRHPAIDLAGAELVRYQGLMAGRPGAAVLADHAGAASAGIELGLSSHFSAGGPAVAGPAEEDAIRIQVRDSKGVIAGSNPRSVLFATYRFLEACGCRWVRPGPDGDYVPSRRIDNLTVTLADRAGLQFRGNSNSGTYNVDFIVSKIGWGPKVGLNTFFNEFLIPRKNYVHWYGRQYPSAKAPEARTDLEIRAYHELLNREVKRRGLLLHAAGYGWNARFLGNPETECDHEGRLIVPEEQVRHLALVKGERSHKGPTTTELCYSDPEVRRGLVRLVADYAQEHPEVDFLHFWLDDRMNDTCECERCRPRRVADLYVELLNGIDDELARRNLPTRIVFLIYQDLLWPPEQARLVNQDRFVLMFAPISRLYDKPYEIPPAGLALPPYQLNQNKSPHDIQTNVAFLQGWQRMFRGPGFAYDYHLIAYHYFDQGYYALLDVLSEDIRRLPQLNLQGFVSCQNQKTFFPHGLPLYAHAKLLWNPQARVEDLAREYFDGAFGSDGALVLSYMKSLSEAFSPGYFFAQRRVRGEGPADPAAQQAAREKLLRIPGIIRDFRPLIARNQDTGPAVHRRSWSSLAAHAAMAELMAEALRARLDGAAKDERARWSALRDWLVANESAIEDAFDVWWFQRAFPGVK